MTIGEALKIKRKQAKKTQAEWVKGIVSTSYYAKIEKNQHRITAEDLFAILKQNDLSISKFFEHMEKDNDDVYHNVNVLLTQALEANYQNDEDKLYEIKKRIEQLDLPEDKKNLALLQIDGYQQSIIIDRGGTPDKKLLQQFKQQIFEVEEPTEETFIFYCNGMEFYDLEDNRILAKRMLNQIDTSHNIRLQETYLGIITNLLMMMWEENDYTDLQYYLNLAQQFPKRPELFFVQLSFLFIKSIIQYHFAKKDKYLNYCRSFIQTLEASGWSEVARQDQQTLETELEKDK